METQTELFETAKNAALKEQISSGKMLSDKERILAYAKKKGYFFLPEIIKDLGIPHKTATGRLSDLEDIGILSKGKRMKTKYNGRYSIYGYVSDTKKQMVNAHERKMKKFGQWLKKSSDFKDMIETSVFEKLTA